MLYDRAHNWLGWPDPERVFEPVGAGAQVYAQFAQKKIGGALKLAYPGTDVKVGVIAADPNSDHTETPLAVVCEFPRAARDQELDLAHALAWNFSRTALLITLEPQRLIAWSCYQDPTASETKRRVCELPTPGDFKPTGTPQQREVRDLLHWVSLITSRVQRERPAQFPAEGRADALLLKNLRYVRSELIKQHLSKEFCHDLLARVIFTQFLFHRKDSAGEAFFSERMMRRLHEEGTLSKIHPNLGSVLGHKADAYSLFQWMDERFNGDLFPGKENDDDETREAAWRIEHEAVTKSHLDLLAGLVRGDLNVADKQLKLWPHYSFDTIPLEFISSVYEEFLTEERGRDKAYYTPSHLVDYVLDAVLPWNDDNWDIRVLDPCCGSGIFLVKAFQRIIHRWRRANGRDPLVTDLRPILANNLVGVDKNEEAVRVACFSLYLAMADAIEPKHYVTRDNVKVFPRLRGIRLLPVDFFDEETNGIRTAEDKDSYDLVIGNAPWGDGSIRPERKPDEPKPDYDKRCAENPTKAQVWAKHHKWPVANNDIGPVFLGKAASLVVKQGRVAMVETASLLYWRDGRAEELRKLLFSSFTFDEITNLSALRREMFSGAIGPACVVVFSKEAPQPGTILYYFTPKAMRVALKSKRSLHTTQGFTVEPQDVNTLTHEEATNESFIWPLLALGGRRDLSLVRRLMGLPNLAKLELQAQVATRLGVIPGDRKKKLGNEFKERRYFELTQFPEDVFLELEAATVQKWKDPRIDGKGSTDFTPFKAPQLLIKQSFSVKLGRFRAALVKTDDPEWGVICKKTYLTVRDLSLDAAHIRGACVAYNSRLAAYFLGLTSSRIGHYITETLSEELVTVPLPMSAPDVSSLNSFDAVDEATRKLYSLTAADWALVEDFLDYSLPDALRKRPGPARQHTTRKDTKGSLEPDLIDYAKTFVRMVKGTFGRERAISSSIYAEPDTRRLPVRMVTIHLDAHNGKPVTIQPMEADGLLDQLARFHDELLKKRTRAVSGGGLGFQRVAYFFHPSREASGRAMNLTIAKPDERRYWTRSMAMRDADQLAGAIAKAATRTKSAT